MCVPRFQYFWVETELLNTLLLFETSCEYSESRQYSIFTILLQSNHPFPSPPIFLSSLPRIVAYYVWNFFARYLRTYII